MKATLTLNVPQLMRAIVAHLEQRSHAGVDEQKEAIAKASLALAVAATELGKVLIHRVDVTTLDVVARFDLDLTE